MNKKKYEYYKNKLILLRQKGGLSNEDIEIYTNLITKLTNKLNNLNNNIYTDEKVLIDRELMITFLTNLIDALKINYDRFIKKNMHVSFPNAIIIEINKNINNFYKDYNRDYLLKIIKSLNEIKNICSEKQLNILVYNFTLKNYPSITLPKYTELYLNELSESDNENDCDIINTDNYNTESPRLRSCDLLKGTISSNKNSLINNGMDNLHFRLINIDSNDLLNFINNNGAKRQNKIKITLNNNDTVRNLYDLQLIHIVFDEIIKLFTEFWKDNNIIKDNTQNDLIKFLNPNEKTKYIVMGDFHGSLATFIRHLFRWIKMGVLDNYCKLINDYEMIFLGDIVDRGVYGFELMMLIYLLIVNNPGKIHYNRGNHEELVTMTKYGLIKEIAIQFGNKVDIEFINTVNQYREYNNLINLYNEYLSPDVVNIINKYNYIISLQHSALVIKNPINNKYIYLSHGGLPIDNKNLSKTFINQLNNNHNIFIPIIPNPNFDLDILNINSSIRWSDYHNNYFTINSPETGRGIGYVIGLDIINEAINNNIEFIIRGHQDSEGNAWLLTSEGNGITLLDNIVMPFNNNNKYACKTFTHKLKLNDNLSVNINDANLNYDVYPVLTISTNTDYGRPLTSDSFIILKFIDNEILDCSPDDKF
jgi:hypothetical protein